MLPYHLFLARNSTENECHLVDNGRSWSDRLQKRATRSLISVRYAHWFLLRTVISTVFAIGRQGYRSVATRNCANWNTDRAGNRFRFSTRVFRILKLGKFVKTCISHLFSILANNLSKFKEIISLNFLSIKFIFVKEKKEKNSLSIKQFLRALMK